MDYLIEKIKNAKYSSDPFNHIYIENFFLNQISKKSFRPVKLIFQN